MLEIKPIKNNGNAKQFGSTLPFLKVLKQLLVGHF